MKDIAPDLLATLQNSFKSLYESNKRVQELLQKPNTYENANFYSVEVGEMLAKVFQENLSGDILPDGKMYYNIAKRVIEPCLAENHRLVADFTEEVQTILNNDAGMHVKALRPELSQDRIDGFINRLSNEEFEKVRWLLDEPVKNFTQVIVDDAIKQNADFHHKLGLQPKIVRKSMYGCCEWCNALAGSYDYPRVPKDVYRRHDYCRCQVDYHPGDGRRQDVHTKKWVDPDKEGKIQKRKALAKKRANINIRNSQFGKKANTHMKDYALDVTSKEDRNKFKEIILDIAENHDEVIRKISWRGQDSYLTGYIKGEDVVLVNDKSEFITVLKGGIHNARIKNSRK